eukprot:Opistho-1_new@47929
MKGCAAMARTRSSSSCVRRSAGTRAIAMGWAGRRSIARRRSSSTTRRAIVCSSTPPDAWSRRSSSDSPFCERPNSGGPSSRSPSRMAFSSSAVKRLARSSASFTRSSDERSFSLSPCTSARSAAMSEACSHRSPSASSSMCSICPVACAMASSSNRIDGSCGICTTGRPIALDPLRDAGRAREEKLSVRFGPSADSSSFMSAPAIFIQSSHSERRICRSCATRSSSVAASRASAPSPSGASMPAHPPASLFVKASSCWQRNWYAVDISCELFSPQPVASISRSTIHDTIPTWSADTCSPMYSALI